MKNNSRQIKSQVRKNSSRSLYSKYKKKWSRSSKAISSAPKSRKNAFFWVSNFKNQKVKIQLSKLLLPKKIFTCFADYITLELGHDNDVSCRKKLLNFFYEIEDFLLKNKDPYRVILNLKNVKGIYPDGAAFFFAMIDKFAVLYPHAVFKIRYQKKPKRVFGVNTKQINFVFNHLELYKLINDAEAPTEHLPAPPHLDVWKTIEFEEVSDQAGEVLEHTTDTVSLSYEKVKLIYRILIEAVNNCPEHAYHPPFMKDENLIYNKTRCLFAIIKNELVVTVIDLGVGVRYTLENGKARGYFVLFRRLHEIYSNFSYADSDYLDGMINIKNIQSRHNKKRDKSKHRGKGGIDLRETIKELKGKIQISSGRGRLTLEPEHGYEPQKYDYPEEFHGTIVSLRIPLTITPRVGEE